MITVKCLNDTAKPNDIKSCNWVKKGQEYTVVKIVKSIITGEQFFVLEEIQPDAPYGGYKVNRFGIEVDIDKLVEENKLEEELC